MSREAWVNAALEQIIDGDIDAVRVEPLARSLGVTKGSFYHHFANRRELHEAVLQHWEDLGTENIIHKVDSRSRDPIERLQQLCRIIFAADDRGDAIETAIRAWAVVDPVASAVAARVDERRLSYVTNLAVQVGLSPDLAERRARVLYRTLIGEVIWRMAGGPTSTAAELDDLVELLFAT